MDSRFLLDLDYTFYNPGSLKRSTVGALGVSHILVALVMIGIPSMILVMSSIYSIPKFVTDIMVIIFVFLILVIVPGVIFGIGKVSQFQRLDKQGILLDGEIVEIKGKMVTVRGGHSYYVIVTYCFQTPDGRTLTGNQRNIRNDLRYADLPLSGTPVSILYADDDAFVML